ncbi:TPA: NAD(P)-dependent alcohol dehydrogenase [Pseudomonas aeruginosa]|nr:NAD(P)-dependent alcohol dehydrogenase [Pseudomonas aeruginosa]
MTLQIRGYAAQSASTPLTAHRFERRAPRADDLVIDILYCGVCHSDLHQARNEWHNSLYPLVPGHEIIGRVASVGEAVSGFAVGELVGVGCMVDSCRHCAACSEGLEQYCAEYPTLTYNGRDRHDGLPTFGGYSERIVVSARFVLRIPQGLDPKAAKFARALGAEVALFTRSPGKEEEARRLGADQVILSTDPQRMAAVAGRFDLILDTVPHQHDLNPYLATLKRDGTLVLVGLLEPLEPAVHGAQLVMGRRSIAGSAIGGIAETQEMLDFCAAHGIACDIEMIEIQQINQAYERMLASDVKYRFVIDMASLQKSF